MKSKLWIITFCLLLISLVTCGILVNRSISLNKQLEVATANEKAFSAQLDKTKGENYVFQLKIDQLELFNDSIANKLKKVQKENNIKDSKIQEFQYMLADYKKKDTVYLSDTIFKEPDFALDTVIGDQWMNTELNLKYPNQICVSPNVRSEKEVVIYTKRETVDPPKKFFLCRWFQKKHTVIKVIVNEENPYIENQESIFIQNVDN